MLAFIKNAAKKAVVTSVSFVKRNSFDPLMQEIRQRPFRTALVAALLATVAIAAGALALGVVGSMLATSGITMIPAALFGTATLAIVGLKVAGFSLAGLMASAGISAAFAPALAWGLVAGAGAGLAAASVVGIRSAMLAVDAFVAFGQKVGLLRKPAQVQPPKSEPSVADLVKTHLSQFTQDFNRGADEAMRAIQQNRVDLDQAMRGIEHNRDLLDGIDSKLNAFFDQAPAADHTMPATAPAESEVTTSKPTPDSAVDPLQFS